jgi:hypothetical protein
MDNLMSPFLGTTPLHHPDEDLQNFQMGANNPNVYLPRQMNFGAAPSTPAPPPLLMPQTPVRYINFFTYFDYNFLCNFSKVISSQ